MNPRGIINKVSIIMAALALCAGAALAAEPGPVTIGGMVGQPLSLGPANLAAMDRATVKLDEVDEKNGPMGSFVCQGPPLKSLLELAGWRKPAGEFPKNVDLGLLVTATDGSQALVAYGEAAHRNPGHILLATSAAPVAPIKPKQADPAYLAALARPVALPKLAIEGDFSRRRCLEGVRDIQVVALPPVPFKGLHHPPRAESFVIRTAAGKTTTISDLKGLAPLELTLKCTGDGRGYEGLRRFRGASLRELLLRAGVEPSPTKGVLVTSGDGYRSLLSSGELFDSPDGAQIILAEEEGGAPIDHGGRFVLAVPGDLWADRWVKSVASIEVVDFRRPGGLYVIGMGCGDPGLLTQRAISTLGMCDSFVAPADIVERFGPYLGGKPVLFDPMNRGRGADADKAAGLIRAELERGRSVAFLDWGDPLVYGAWRWLMRHMEAGEIHFVAGVGAFGAGAAAVGRNITCNAMVELTDGRSVLADEGLVEAAARRGGTMAIFMAERQLAQVVPLLAAHYPPETPVAVVAKAGYHPGEKVVRTTVGGLTGFKSPDKWLSLIFVGPCLKWESERADRFKPGG